MKYVAQSDKLTAFGVFFLLAAISLCILATSCSPGYDLVQAPKPTPTNTPTITVTTKPALSSDCLAGGVEIDINSSCSFTLNSDNTVTN